MGSKELNWNDSRSGGGSISTSAWGQSQDHFTPFTIQNENLHFCLFESLLAQCDWVLLTGETMSMMEMLMASVEG